MLYDQAEKNEGAYRGIMAQKYDEGKLEGKIEGKIEGKLEGKLESKIEIAKNCLNQGFKISDICNITGLTLEEIEAIQAKNELN